jgi:hypothetical protein
MMISLKMFAADCPRLLVIIVLGEITRRSDEICERAWSTSSISIATLLSTQSKEGMMRTRESKTDVVACVRCVPGSRAFSRPMFWRSGASCQPRARPRAKRAPIFWWSVVCVSCLCSVERAPLVSFYLPAALTVFSWLLECWIRELRWWSSLASYLAPCGDSAITLNNSNLISKHLVK